MRGGTPNMTAATAAATNTAPNRKNRAGAIRLAIAISDALPDGAAIRLDRRDENRDRLGGGRPAGRKIGRASCRERVCQSVSISVVAVSLNKNTYKPYVVNTSYTQNRPNTK